MRHPRYLEDAGPDRVLALAALAGGVLVVPLLVFAVLTRRRGLRWVGLAAASACGLTVAQPST
jgi:hypothetical protein